MSHPPSYSSCLPSRPFFVAPAGCSLSRCLCCWRLCHRCACFKALVALASLPLLRWYLCQSPPLPLPTSIASAVKRSRQSPITNHRHHPPPTQSIDISLSPLPRHSPLPPLNAAMLSPLLNAPTTTTTTPPAAIASCRCRRAALTPTATRHRRLRTRRRPLQKKEATTAPPPVYQWQYQRENVYKSRRLGLI